jgi:hypothetical protein
VDVTDPIANEYFRERMGIAGANAVCDTRVPCALWRVRYFRDSQPEEYAVILRPDGSLHSFRHILAEETPGASLSKEQAVARAERFLREEKKLDLKAWTLVEPSSEKRPHRIDHTLTWQQNEPLDPLSGSAAGKADHAYARLDVQVLGEEVANYRTYAKIPEDWRRKHEEFSLSRTVFSYVIPILFFLGLGGTMLILYLKNLKSEAARSIPWRRIGFWSLGGLFGILAVFAFGNRIATFLSLYNTAIPLKMTFGIFVILAVFGVLFNFGGIAILFGIAWYFASRAFGPERLPVSTRLPAEYFRDALWIGLGGAAGLLGLERLLASASAYWPTAHRSLPASFGQGFDAIFPAGSVLGGTLIHGLFVTGMVVAVASFLAAHIPQPLLRISVLAAGALAMTGGGWGSPADLGKQLLARLILLSVLVFGVERLMRFNLLGCFLVVASTSLVSGAAELLGQPDSFYRANGYAVLLALGLLFAWPLAAWRLRATASPT